MKRFKVILLPTAKADIQTSYEWGCRVWGVRQANSWSREMYKECKERLGSMPERFPLAPENDEFPIEVRQMLAGRYRILFTIKSKTVYVFHIQGAYVGSTDEIL